MMREQFEAHAMRGAPLEGVIAPPWRFVETRVALASTGSVRRIRYTFNPCGAMQTQEKPELS